MTYSDCREGDGGLVRIGLSCDRQYLFASTREFVLAPGITPFDIYRIGLRRRCIEPVAVNLDVLSNHGFRSQFPAHAICLSGQRRPFCRSGIRDYLRGGGWPVPVGVSPTPTAV